MTNDLDDRRRKTNMVKDIVKEAIKEWMDERYFLAKQRIGGWTISCFCAMGLCLFVRMLIHFHILDVKLMTDTAFSIFEEKGI